uniref:Metalloendopeptidase n=1 Tax=Parastrongyloides trichosuri TaxID=131310 RepID=A0A0N5A5S5_PARTI
MRETCLEFEESKKQKINKSLIEFIRSNSFCLSEIGKRSTNNNTKIQLTDFCSRQFGTVGHEVLHALGVGHEQQRSDRNKYVKINDNNIKSGYERNFKKHDNYNWMSFEIPYDYASIMHYKKNALSKNGKNTLKAKNIELFNDMMGHESVFSFNDIKLINYYYCRNECSFSKM